LEVEPCANGQLFVLLQITAKAAFGSFSIVGLLVCNDDDDDDDVVYLLSILYHALFTKLGGQYHIDKTKTPTLSSVVVGFGVMYWSQYDGEQREVTNQCEFWVRVPRFRWLLHR
jgi:hypothetical protein